jgi:hypothetical protein
VAVATKTKAVKMAAPATVLLSANFGIAAKPYNI